MSTGPAQGLIAAAGGNVTLVERPGGVRLRAASFGDGEASGGCLFLSGYTEFIEKHLESIVELTTRGFRVATLDWRGQGLSDRLLPDRHKGHIDRMETHLEDLQATLEVLDGFRDGPLLVVGHSMGGHVALRYCLEHRQRVRRAVLIAPMLGIGRPGMPDWLAKRLVEWLCRTPLVDGYIFGGAGYGPRRLRFDGNPLTDDRARFDLMHTLLAENPDLVVADPTFAWVRAAIRSIDAVMAPGVLEGLSTPMLIALAGREVIVSNRAIEEAAARLPAARLERFPDAKHEILREREAIRLAFWEAVDRFLADTGS